MKIKKQWIITTLFIMMLCPITVRAAGACTAVIDKNGYCDETGEYHDPTLSTIKDNNCSSYKEDIVPGYCYSICREDATTKFPNKVPWLSVDQYDSILGGNHFIWEEIVTTRTRECETTINWDKWKREWEEVTGNDSGIDFLVMHIAREEHQRNSDVPVCELLNGENFTGENAWHNDRFYQNFDVDGKAAKGLLANIAGSSNLNKMKEYFGCKAYTEETKASKTANVKTSGNSYATIPSGTQPNDYKKTCTNQLSSAQKKRYTYAEVIQQSEGLVCWYYTCPSGVKPTDKGKCQKEVQKSKTGCKNGQDHIWSKVDFNWLRDGFTIANPQTYCAATDSIPYNTLRYDAVWNDFVGEGASGGSNGYRLSLNEFKQKIQRLESILRTCNTSNNASNSTDTTSITVNYQDQPSKTYKRDVPLTKNRVGSPVVESKTTKASNSTIYKSNCMNVSASALSGVISINDIAGILGSTNCQKQEYTELRNYTNTSIYSKISEKFKYTMPEKTYRYIQKTDGKAVDQVSGDILTNKRYIDIGYPNYPVYYKTPTGTYPMQLTYQNIGTNGHFVDSAVYSCKYKVINRIIPCTGADCYDPDCVGEHCDRNYDNGGGDTGLNGLNIIYRPISLTNPFPSETGTGREAGVNWTESDISNYITKNRKVTENDVYNKTPIYSFTLTPASIKKIKGYNSTTEYSDFNLTCSSQKNGKRCTSNFLKNLSNYNVIVNQAQSTCYNVGQGDAFYSCADKPVQDNVRCLWNSETKKMDCVNCSAGQGNENHKICVLAKGKGSE